MNTYTSFSKLLVCGAVAAVTNAVLVWGALQATSVVPPERNLVIAAAQAPAPMFASAMLERAASAALVE